MHIANPIYDTVFKYLLDDNDSAKLLLSALLDEEIESLTYLAQEGVGELKREHRSLTVYRLDFSAKIKTQTGYKQILIEIQKAKFASDIMRFRRYLGEQYNRNSQTNEQGKPLPIHTIYFLGYKLDHIKTPIIRVNRHYYDGSTGQRLEDEREVFIESLSHDSLIVQIPYLHQQRHNELLQLLSIFDQQQHLQHDQHILNINDQDYPPKYQKLIQRLQRAIAEDSVRLKMDVEDDILLELADKERVLEKKDVLIAKMEIEKEQLSLLMKEQLQQIEALKQQLKNSDE